jgi:phosphoserine aminotransferase
MLSFYPGPSKLNSSVPEIIQQALESDILSYNHRNKQFVEVIEATVVALKSFLNVPIGYQILFVNSATECWQILSQSLIKKKSFHLYNGSFGERWHQFTNQLGKLSFCQEFSLNSALPWVNANDADLICITHVETSNGSIVKDEHIKNIKESNPNAIIAVDATSSLGGQAIDISAADIWFASVQKCFGMPSGLAILICSDHAIEKAKFIDGNKHYNSLSRLASKMSLYQTNNTPNMLGIYVLGKLAMRQKNIKQLAIETQKKSDEIKYFFSNIASYKILIDDFTYQSDTVFAIKSLSANIEFIKNKAKEHNILLGNGYGKWSEETFRIANFPAHNEDDLEHLFHFFTKYL